MVNNELQHHGTKGMKWGRRRYQNPDGSLTAAGRKRYARDAREKEYDKYDESTSKYYKESKKNGRSDLSVDADRYVREDLDRSKKVATEAADFTRKAQNLNRATANMKPKTRMDLSNMSDKELRDKINRELLERQYNDVFSPEKESRGREYVNNALEVAGSVLGVTGSALGVALSIKMLLGD